ncbi:MAG: Uma2 family endonuclease, partial [Cyanobacteria bacterium P01_D01_bin.44]
RLQGYTEDEYFTASDLNVYYDPDNRLWHKRPDWFLAVGVPFLSAGGDMRLSYVTWQEAVNPFVVVELISPGTEAEDLGETTAEPEAPPPKWVVYEQILQVPYYVVFNRYTDELRVFKLAAGHYQEQSLPDNRLWIPELDIGLGLWYGTYAEGTHRQTERQWLRWYDADGQWLMTDAELARQRTEAERQRAEAERQRAEAERQRAEAERQRAEAEQQKALAEQRRANDAEVQLATLKAKLRAQGIDPNGLLE